MDFLGLGVVEILLIVILVFLVSEPDKMVEMAKTIGRIMRQLKQTSTEFINDITAEIKEIDKVKKDATSPD